MTSGMKASITPTGTSTMIRFFLASVIFFVFSATAHAGACDSKAASMSSWRGAKVIRVLNVRDAGSKCRITVLLQAPSSAPKKKTISVSK